MAEALSNELEGIPAPSGRYEVGCTHLMHQNLQIRLYYPTESDLATTLQRATYYPHPNYLKAWLEIFSVSLSSLKPGELSLFESQKIPALLDAPLIQNIIHDHPKGFPVVVYSHGLACHFLHSSGFCSDLASHGYVVAAVEHRDSSATLALRRVPGPGVQEGQYEQYVDEWIPFNMIISITHPERRTFNYPFRNKQIKQRAKEMGQALDILYLLNEGGDVHNMLGRQFDFSQFKGRLNMELAAVAGHSFGGGTVIQTLSEDPRFRCGIALDAWTFPLSEDVYINGIQQPLILINSSNYQTAKDIENMMKLLKSPSDTDLATHTLYTIKETSHASQTDIPFALTPELPMGFIDLSLDKYVAHKVNMDICHAFLKRFLLQDPVLSGHVPILDGGEGASEYVICGTNVERQK